MAANKASLRKIGGSDTGYTVAQCDAPECRDINGRPWQHMFSRRTVEGARLAQRDMDEHNNHRHAESE